MNRKQFLVIKLILLIILFALVCGFSWRMVTKGWGFVQFSFGAGDLVASETYDSASEIHVEVQSSAIEVLTHDEDTVRVEVYRTGFSTVADPVISRSGTVVSVTQAKGLGISLGGGKVLIYVPAGSVMPYDLKTVSGSIRLSAQGTDLTLKTTSGSIRAFAGGDTIDARTVSGSIRVFEPFRTVNCETTSGSIRARADSATVEAGLRTVSGSVVLALQDVSGYSMTHQTVSGSVKDTYQGTDYAKSGAASWGDQSLRISMKTTSGSIKLTDWDD